MKPEHIKKFLKKYYFELLICTVYTISITKFVYGLYSHNDLYPFKPLYLSQYNLFRLITWTLLTGLLAWSIIAAHTARKQKENHDWLVSAVSSYTQKFDELDKLVRDKNLDLNTDLSTNDVITEVRHWPWGNHHTETLGHLEAAAQRFWRLYDPGDISTAPTNDMVATWLQNERGISKEKARAIASMLRPDGLPTGPRR